MPSLPLPPSRPLSRLRPALPLFLLALAVAARAHAAEPSGADYLALRGAAGMEVKFNAFAPARDSAVAGPGGYLAWKNTCVPVERMAAGGSFRLGGGNGGGGFAGVMPYVLPPEPVAAVWLEILAEVFAHGAGAASG